ncbi:MAG TPA: hypothetical protein EYN71_05320 [Flavobacteriales bacterium]|nr:hypothetical protein [Flavobacteriales bacterium]HIO68482.1 hypothetical protein [Flavobacteriales bacterium]
MRINIYLAFVLFLVNCGSANKHDQYLTKINNVTKSSCATGYEYSFSVAGNNVSILYNSPHTELATYTAVLSDLQFSWNTLSGGVEGGIDHEVIIACPGLGDDCWVSKSGEKSRITIEIKGEEAAQSLLSNLSYLKGLSE